MRDPTSLSRRRFLTGGTMLGATALPSSLAAAFEPAEVLAPVPDAGFDQTSVIQRTADEAQTRGDVLFLPPGHYYLSGVRLGSGARIVGVPGATRLVLRGNAAIFSAAGATRITLNGLVLDGNAESLGEATGLVDFRGVGQVDIENCEIDGSPGSGFYLADCGGRIMNSRVLGAHRAGIFSLDGRDLDIAGNTVSDCGDNGILVWQSEKREDGARIRSNRIERIHARSGGSGQNGNGINVFRAGSVTVSDNRITDCAFSAIRCNAADNVMVTGNSCSRLGEVALYAEFGFQGAVISHNLIDGAAIGISVTNFNEGGRLAVVSSNLVRNIGSRAAGEGNGIFAEADTSISGNVVENAGFAALALGYGPYLRGVVATGNILRDSRHGIAVSIVAGAGAALISDNFVSSERGAIVGMEWETIVADDLTSKPERFPNLTIERNRAAAS